VRPEAFAYDPAAVDTRPDNDTRDLDREYEDAPCIVCRILTRLRCSPCEQAICHNCACPNGCDVDGAEISTNLTKRFERIGALPE
jgi:hypothetical protein